MSTHTMIQSHFICTQSANMRSNFAKYEIVVCIRKLICAFHLFLIRFLFKRFRLMNAIFFLSLSLCRIFLFCMNYCSIVVDMIVAVFKLQRNAFEYALESSQLRLLLNSSIKTLENSVTKRHFYHSTKPTSNDTEAFHIFLRM